MEMITRKMEKITHETVLSKHALCPKQRSFATHPGITAYKKGRSDNFYVPFSESIKPIFDDQTELTLLYNSGNKKRKKHYCMINNNEELDTIKNWEIKQGRLVFLRDCLSISLALDFYVNPKDWEKNEIGKLEHQGKTDQNQNAIEQLAGIVSKKIIELQFYNKADLICSVPSHHCKEFDLPRSVTSLVSNKICKQDITKGFAFSKQKDSITNSSIENKWNIWNNAELSFNDHPAISLEGKTVILIDDKYQSGTTIQYIAMKLQEAGAREVYGLCFVKTLSNTDNVPDSQKNE